MENRIIIDGKLHGGMKLKHSQTSGRPYINFTIICEPEDTPPFYFRCYASGELAYLINRMNLGQKVKVEGNIESALMTDELYAKQIRCTTVNKI